MLWHLKEQFINFITIVAWNDNGTAGIDEVTNFLIIINQCLIRYYLICKEKSYKSNLNRTFKSKIISDFETWGRNLQHPKCKLKIKFKIFPKVELESEIEFG
jgi:hypothetical protein